MGRNNSDELLASDVPTEAKMTAALKCPFDLECHYNNESETAFAHREQFEAHCFIDHKATFAEVNKVIVEESNLGMKVTKHLLEPSVETLRDLPGTLKVCSDCEEEGVIMVAYSSVTRAKHKRGHRTHAFNLSWQQILNKVDKGSKNYKVQYVETASSDVEALEKKLAKTRQAKANATSKKRNRDESPPAPRQRYEPAASGVTGHVNFRVGAEVGQSTPNTDAKGKKKAKVESPEISSAMHKGVDEEDDKDFRDWEEVMDDSGVERISTSGKQEGHSQDEKQTDVFSKLADDLEKVSKVIGDKSSKIEIEGAAEKVKTMQKVARRIRIYNGSSMSMDGLVSEIKEDIAELMICFCSIGDQMQQLMRSMPRFKEWEEGTEAWRKIAGGQKALRCIFDSLKQDLMTQYQQLDIIFKALMALETDAMQGYAKQAEDANNILIEGSKMFQDGDEIVRKICHLVALSEDKLVPAHKWLEAGNKRAVDDFQPPKDCLEQYEAVTQTGAAIQTAIKKAQHFLNGASKQEHANAGLKALVDAVEMPAPPAKAPTIFKDFMARLPRRVMEGDKLSAAAMEGDS